MGDCWSTWASKDELEINKPTEKKTSRKSNKKGAIDPFINTKIEQAIEETGTSEQLWTDVDKIESDDEEPDSIENHEITFERRGKSHNLFSKEFMAVVEGEFPPNIKKVYRTLGQYKYLKSDWAQLKLSKSDLEFKGQMKKKGDTYIGEVRKGTEIQEGRGILIVSP